MRHGYKWRFDYTFSCGKWKLLNDATKEDQLFLQPKFINTKKFTMYLTPGVGAPIPVLVPGFFNEVPGPVDQTT